VKYYDMPTVRAFVKDAAKQDYRFSAIVMGIVNSPAFQMDQVPQPEEAIQTQALGPRPPRR
jgi:hypothetical protein